VINESLLASFVTVTFSRRTLRLRFTLNPFQSRDAIWHHTFNSVLHVLQFLGGWKGLTLSSPKKL
jgi:hypothetical protein